MRTFLPITIPAAIVGTVLLAFAVLPPRQAATESAEDWHVLFNGEDLTGWRLLNGQHIAEVEGGVIVLTSIPGLPNGFLATDEDYDDFILELEVKADLLLHNSGIQFRSLSHEGYRDGRVHGYQAEVDITPQAWSGGIYDEARRGWLYILEDDDAPAKKAFVNNQWNHYRIEAIGTTNRIWVNGIPTAHLVDEMTTRGFIGLQVHANSRPTDPPGENQVRFRNIRIRTENLQPSPFDDVFVVNTIPNDLSGQERHQGYTLLWDGRTLNGWRGVPSTEAPNSGWQIEDGVLTIDEPGGEGGVLMTEREFGAFELTFEFLQHEAEAIMGLEYHVDRSERVATYGRLAAKKTRPVGEWNLAHVRVYPDGRAQYWLNQYKILEYQRDHPLRGHLVLDHYGSPVSYRSIKIRSLN